MFFTQLLQQFLEGVRETSLPEYVAVAAGIAGVWFSIRENILVYPVGLLSTIIYIFLSFKGGLLGEAGVNFYYTVMSVIGWYMWSQKDRSKRPVLHISVSSRRELLVQFAFFSVCWIVLYLVIRVAAAHGYIKGAIPLPDSFAGAAAYTGMWLMNKKKMENWHWWIATNIVSIPLYFVKGYVLTSVYYLILLVMAFAGLVAWRRKYHAQSIATEAALQSA